MTQPSPSLSEAARTFLEARGGGELATRMGIEILELSPERSVATMPADGNRQPVGVIHGGAYCVLGESLGSMSATMHAQPDGYAVGVDINATHTRSVTDGIVTGVCTAIHLGRSTTVHEIAISDEEGRRVSTIRITNFIKRIPA